VPKVYLDRLKEKYGWTGGKYRSLMDMIIAENHVSIARAVARVKVRNMKEYGAKLKRQKNKQMLTPELDDVLPKRSVFFRKGAEQGKLLTDSLRSRLAADLRTSVQEYLKQGKGTMQYQIGGQKGRMKPKLIDALQKRISESFAGYTKVDPEIGVPPNVRAIAVTEMRSVVDDIKWEFAKRMVEKNPGMQAQKRWKHNTHLVKTPRPGHLALDGVTIPIHEKFSVEQENGGVVLMDHPHAPGAPPEEVISCQCEVDYLFDMIT
jgi:hypothetical protein